MTAQVATLIPAKLRPRRRARALQTAAPQGVAADRAALRHDVAVATASGLAGAVGLGVGALVALLLLIGAAGQGGTDAAAPDEGPLATVSE